MNQRGFTKHEVVFPTDGQYGDIAPDGSIHGSLMMINKELADVAIGPFNLEYIQWKVFPTATQLKYDNFQLISGMKDPFVSDSGAFINIFDKESAELRLVLLIASCASRNAASEWRPRGRQSWILFLISLTSLIVLSTAFYRIAGRQRKTSLFYDTSKYFYAYIEVLFFEATKVQFVPQANRILLAVWLIACFILINLFNGEVKANLLVKSDTERINTAEDVLRHPKLLPLTMKNSPLTTALQISSSESVRRLWDRMDAMGGAIPVPEVFTAKSLQMVQQRKAVIATDMMTGRVQSSLFCPVLDGFFYVGTQSITNLRSVWYYRKRIDPDVVRGINKRRSDGTTEDTPGVVTKRIDSGFPPPPLSTTPD
ncbi:hypothetical protein HPB47_014030 [Ixodes persulcatus]|uniref:Uncharacterized protein n=1 Tax=Ixodes persulcatus TaxID=34615 RepID=A0AC60QX67_IXOPE|nr:hypothetical protein HPB47_014030 [Ixodes persulcatus]